MYLGRPSFLHGTTAWNAAFAISVIAASGLPAQSSTAAAPHSPGDSVAITYLDDVARERSFGINYQYEHVSGGFDPWHVITLDGKDQIGASTVIGRLHFARRLAQTGAQAELEAYPRLNRRSYLYLNAARRVGDRLFIRTRGAAELYHNFPGGWEGSFGGRYFDREQVHDLFGLTGTVGKYVGNYWHSLRPTVVFRDGGASRSLALTSRRYFATRYDYIGLRLSGGSAPDETRDDATRLERDGLRSYSVGIERRQTLRNERYRVNYGVGFERDEYRRDALGKAVARQHFMVQAGSEIILR